MTRSLQACTHQLAQQAQAGTGSSGNLNRTEKVTVPPGRHGEKGPGDSGGFFISVQLDVEGAWADQPLAEPEAQLSQLAGWLTRRADSEAARRGSGGTDQVSGSSRSCPAES